MSGRLEGKVALIAGSASGMGCAGAVQMAEQGARVVFGDLNVAEAERHAETLHARGLEAAAVALDIADPDQTRAAVEFTVSRFGRLDVLHNNAAIFSSDVAADQTMPIGDIDIGVFDRIMQVNVRGFILLSQAALPHMARNGGGSIINTSSMVSLAPEPRLNIYSISKAAVNMLTLCLAANYGHQGIRCNAVLPALVNTHGMTGIYVDLMDRHMPVPYAATAEDLANLFVFLASDESRMINGQLIRVDGGLLSKMPYFETYRDALDQSATPYEKLAG